MDPYCEQADDDKYTIGIAAALCLASLPVIYFGTRFLVSTLHTPWRPWPIALLFILVPPIMASIPLYTHAWHQKWSRPKRIFLSALLSCIIFVADLVLLAYFAIIGFTFGICFLGYLGPI